jgi:hypothetical protein
MRERMGHAAHERFLQRFHAAAMAEQMERVYMNVLEAGNA